MYLQGKVVAQGTFDHIVDLATVKEDNPQSVILRGVLSEMLEEDDEGEEAHKELALDAITEEGEEDDVFTKKPPASPFTLPTPSALRPRVFASKPKLLRRVTDMDLVRRRTSLTPLLLSPATPKLRRPSSKFGPSVPQGSPRASRYSSQRGQTPVTTQPVPSASPQIASRRVSQALFKRPAPLLRSATEGVFNLRRRSSAFQSRPSLAQVASK